MATQPCRAVTLSDGRQLAYAEHGDLNAPAVIYFHSLPGSRLERPDILSPIKNIRLICVDRPGYGESSLQENRTLLNWADDIVELADALALETFSIIGFSGGGPHALACAYKIPQRLKNVVVCNSSVSLNADVPGKALPAQLKSLYELSCGDIQNAINQLKPFASSMLAIMSVEETPLPEVDKKIFRQPTLITQYKASLAESFKQGTAALA